MVPQFLDTMPGLFEYPFFYVLVVVVTRGSVFIEFFYAAHLFSISWSGAVEMGEDSSIQNMDSLVTCVRNKP